jgi:hypothetical protein
LHCFISFDNRSVATRKDFRQLTALNHRGAYSLNVVGDDQLRAVLTVFG